MKITDILSSSKRTLSFEVFPPKMVENFASVLAAATEISTLNPAYMSVTYGAGGGTSLYTADIASKIQNFGVSALVHLTCVSSSREKVQEVLSNLRNKKIENILALRGDIPDGLDRSLSDYKYASELVSEIRNFGGFCISGACYPEGHPESISRAADLLSLKNKVDSGCEFLTTQMFFDNSVFYRFVDELSHIGVSVPVVAGIMPITSAAQVDRMIKFSGSALPKELVNMIDRFGHDSIAMKEAGIEYATEQIMDLYEAGFGFAHVYSMNKPDVARKIKSNLEFML